MYSVSEEAFVPAAQFKELEEQGLAGDLVHLKEDTYFLGYLLMNSVSLTFTIPTQVL